METKATEAVGKKRAIRLMINNGPSELDWLFSFARRQFIPLTFVSTNLDSPSGSKREVAVCIDGLEWSTDGPPDEPIWRIRGHFDADGKKSWVTHPDESAKINLWGGFSGEYNKRTRLGAITTLNWITDQERARQLAREDEEISKEESAIGGLIVFSVKAYVEGIKSPDGFFLTDMCFRHIHFAP